MCVANIGNSGVRKDLPGGFTIPVCNITLWMGISPRAVCDPKDIAKLSRQYLMPFPPESPSSASAKLGATNAQLTQIVLARSG